MKRYWIIPLVLGMIIGIVRISSVSAAGSTYYVSPAGSDSNNGTSSASSFKTIAKAVSVASGGDTIEVLPGNYPKVNISKSGPSATNRIIMKGNGATIVGDSSGNAFNITGSNWNFEGFTVTEGYSHGVHIQGKNINLLNMTARNNVTENRSGDGVCGSNDGWGSGFSLKNGSENIVVDNVKIYQNCGEGLAITRAMNVVVSRVTAYDNFSINIYPDNSKDVLIQNSISYCTGDTRFNRNNERPKGIVIGEEDYSKWGDSEWGSKLENVNVINNIIHACHRGISLSTELNYGLRGSLIAHNTIVGIIGAYGLRIINMPNNNNIRVYNNITSKTPELEGPGIQSGGNINTTTYAAALDPRNPSTFTPAGSATAVDAGINTAGVATDFNGNSRPRGGGYDIGAIETGSGGTIPTPTRTPTPVSSPTPTPTPVPSLVCPPVGIATTGTATLTVDLPSTGNYKTWVSLRGAGKLYLRLDNLTCVPLTTASPSFAWVSDGATPLLSSGSHTLTLYGQGVAVDRVILTRNVSCTPDSNGDACIGITSTPTPTRAVSTPTPTRTPAPTRTPTPTPTPSPVTTGGLKRGSVVVGSVQSNSATSVRTSTEMPAGTNQLYVVAISTKPNISVGTVTGLGLTWYPAAAQCGGRSQTRTELWWAYGTPSKSDYISASFANVKSFRSAVIAAVSYDGASANPVLQVMRLNSKATNDTTCAGGKDQDKYAYTTTFDTISGLWIGAVGIRQLGHFPTNSGTEVVEVHTKRGGGDDAGVVIVEYPLSSSGTVSVGGVFTGKVDYSVVGAAFRSR